MHRDGNELDLLFLHFHCCSKVYKMCTQKQGYEVHLAETNTVKSHSSQCSSPTRAAASTFTTSLKQIQKIRIKAAWVLPNKLYVVRRVVAFPDLDSSSVALDNHLDRCSFSLHTMCSVWLKVTSSPDSQHCIYCLRHSSMFFCSAESLNWRTLHYVTSDWSSISVTYSHWLKPFASTVLHHTWQ